MFQRRRLDDADAKGEMMMRSKTLLIFAPLLAGGCTTADNMPEEASAAPAGASVRCIDVSQIIARRPAGPQSVIFELAGGRTYRNDLPDICPGLQRAGRSEIVQIELTGSSLCRNDRVRIYDPVEARDLGVASFPHCRLGDFTPVASR